MRVGISSMCYINDFKLQRRYNNTADLLCDATKDCLEYATKNEIEVCELAIDPPDIYDKKNREKFVKLCNSYSIDKQVNAPFVDVSLCSYNEKVSRASVDCYVETAKLCQEIGAKVMTIHPGSAKDISKYNKVFHKIQLKKAMESLLDSVTGLHLTICIENMQKKTGILLDFEEIEEFFSNINREDLFFTYDTSHFFTCDGNIAQLWDKFHKIIKNVHLVDNFGKSSDPHPALGTGAINFKEIFEIIKKFDYDGSVILELNHTEDLTKSIEYAKNLVEEIS